MRHGNAQQAALIREAIEQGGKREAIDEVLAIMTEHKSLDYAMNRAKEEAQKKQWMQSKFCQKVNINKR